MTIEADPQFLRMAIQLANENVESGGGGPFGAVIVRDGRVLASAANTVTTKNDPTAHAEVNAIRAACDLLKSFQLQDCVVYSSAEPCPMCFSAICWARCAAVFYGSTAADAAAAGFDDDRLYRELRLGPAERSLPMTQVALPDSLEPFARWAAAQQKVAY